MLFATKAVPIVVWWSGMVWLIAPVRGDKQRFEKLPEFIGLLNCCHAIYRFVANGHCCNPAKLLLDPYVKAIDGQVQWDEAVFPYRFDAGPEVRSESDSTPFMPKGVVHQPTFDWDGDRRLQLPWHETVIYETHVKGPTARHPRVPK